MLFQTLDNKKECAGAYYDGNLHFGDELPEGISETWSYSSSLRSRKIRYGYLQCGGESLDSVCPSHIKEDWEKINNKLKAYMRSFQLSKVCLEENCFYDLVPEKFLLKYCEIKNRITKHVLENFLPSKNLRFLTSLFEVVGDINHQKLNVDIDGFKPFLAEYKAREWRKKIKNIPPYIKYDIFGTKTGRLTTKKNSFPILTLAKEYRGIIKPHNDWLVEFDFNAAELRTLLALSDKEQPKEDIHEWNAKNVYRGLVTRDEAKRRIFAWLYNPESKDHLSDRAYDRDKVLKDCWDGSCVKTCFDREIEADKHHALNYVIQSTTSDLFLDRVIDIFNLLEKRKSFVSFFIHDSLIIDFSDEDKELLVELKEIFSNTKLGKFKVNISAGKNFGDMRELKI